MRGFTTEAKLDIHDDLKMSAIKLLLSLIEGSIDSEIYRQIADSFDDFAILTGRMTKIFNKFVTDDLGLALETVTLEQINPCLSKNSFKDKITEGFNIYTLINQLAIQLPDVRDKIADFAETIMY